MQAFPQPSALLPSVNLEATGSEEFPSLKDRVGWGHLSCWGLGFTGKGNRGFVHFKWPRGQQALCCLGILGDPCLVHCFRASTPDCDPGFQKVPSVWIGMSANRPG